MHHGLISASFITPFLSMMGLTSERSDRFWRGPLVRLARRVLNAPRLHRKFATMNGESAVTMMRQLLKLAARPAPVGRAVAGRGGQAPAARRVVGGAQPRCRCSSEIDIPVYLGCDWENVPLHLPSTFTAVGRLRDNPAVRMGMLGRVRADLAVGEPARRGAGLVRPLAEGPRHRHPRRARRSATCCPAPTSGAPPSTGRRRAAPPGTCAAGRRAAGRRRGRARRAAIHGAGRGLNRVKASPIDPPSLLSWTSAPLHADLDIVGDIELRLVASATAIDTAWIATLLDVGPDDTRRAGHRRLGCAPACARSTRRPAARAPRCCRAARPRRCRSARRRLPDPVGAQCPPVRRRPPYPAGPHQRRPGPRDTGDHELPACQRGHQQRQHRALGVAPAASGDFGVLSIATRDRARQGRRQARPVMMSTNSRCTRRSPVISG